MAEMVQFGYSETDMMPACKDFKEATADACIMVSMVSCDAASVVCILERKDFRISTRSGRSVSRTGVSIDAMSSVTCIFSG